MSRRSRRNKYKIKQQRNIEPQQQPPPQAPITVPPQPEEGSPFVGPKKFKQENYRSDTPILFYSLLAFAVFLAIAIIIIIAIGKSAVEGIYR